MENTAEEILKNHMNKAGINFKSSQQTHENILDAMEEYAVDYHQSKLKSMVSSPDVSESHECGKECPDNCSRTR